MFQLLLEWIREYPALLLFLGAIFPGEEVVLFFAFLAGQDVISIEKVFLFGILGFMTADTIWFLLGRSQFFSKIRSWTILSDERTLVKTIISKVGLKTYPAILIATKFIYGTRVAALILIGIKRIKYIHFFLWDTLALLVWAGIMIPLAWLAGKGTSRYLHIATDTQKIFLVALVLLLLLYFINKTIAQRLSKINS